MTKPIFRQTMLLLLLFCIASSFTATAGALYKSVGDDGKVHYTDRPNNEGRTEEIIEVKSLPSSQVPGLTHSYVEQLRALEQWRADYARKNPAPQAAARTGTVLYTASWCGYCKQAKVYLAQHGIGYQEINVETKGGKAEFVQARTRGDGIPLLVVSSRKLAGFDSAAYDAFFANLKLQVK